jgi:CheY-like chemotaxis protein
MGGELSLVSPVPGSERGTLFRFTLPVELADLPAVQAATSQRQVIALAPHQPLYKILVVEDNWANRRLVVQLLTTVGFDVQEAANGQEAIEQWLSWAPRIILMDMRMPVLDGYEATRRIRALAEEGEALTIIALTASALEEDRTEVLAQGCDGFIRKPFRQEELFDALSQHAGVRFIYQEGEEGQEEVGAAEAQTADIGCYTNAISCLPAELVEQLREATLQADLDLIARAIRAIREHDAELAATLKELARNFDHDGILMLIDAAAGSSEEEGA